jgi:hypothetical protein
MAAVSRPAAVFTNIRLFRPPETGRARLLPRPDPAAGDPHQKQLVDQAVGEQGTDELTAAHDHEVASWLLAQRSDLARDVTADQRGVSATSVQIQGGTKRRTFLPGSGRP